MYCISGNVDEDFVVGRNVFNKFQLEFVVPGSDGFECSASIELSLYHHHGVACIITTSSGVYCDYCVPELCERWEIFSRSGEAGSERVRVECDRGAVFVGFCHNCDQFVELVELRVSFDGGFVTWSLLVGGCFGMVDLVWWWDGQNVKQVGS